MLAPQRVQDVADGLKVTFYGGGLVLLAEGVQPADDDGWQGRSRVCLEFVTEGDIFNPLVPDTVSVQLTS